MTAKKTSARPAPSFGHERRHRAAVEPRERPRLRLAVPPWAAAGACRKSSRAAQGDTANATASEKSIAAEAPTGIGRM